MYARACFLQRCFSLPSFPSAHTVPPSLVAPFILPSIFTRLRPRALPTFYPFSQPRPIFCPLTISSTQSAIGEKRRPVEIEDAGAGLGLGHSFGLSIPSAAAWSAVLSQQVRGLASAVCFTPSLPIPARPPCLLALAFSLSTCVHVCGNRPNHTSREMSSSSLSPDTSPTHFLPPTVGAGNAGTRAL